MSSFSKNLWMVGGAVAIYAALTIAAYSPQLPMVLRYSIASLLPLVLAILAGGVLVYAAWASWKFRNAQSVLLLVLSLVLCVLVVPTWLTISRHYAQAAWHGMAGTPETNVGQNEPIEAMEAEEMEMTQPARVQSMPKPLGSHGPVVRRPTKQAQHGGLMEIDNPSELQALIDSGDPVIVKYFATWCGPCQMMKPIFHALADKHGDIAWVEVDSDKLGSNMLHANSLPTFIFFKDGQEAFRQEGMMEEDEFEQKAQRLKNS